MNEREGTVTLREDHGLSEEEIRQAEAHRGYVREMDQVLGKAYGTGGAIVIAALTALVFVGWLMGWLTYLTLWIPGLTGVLACLYFVRRWIYARRDRLRGRVEKYCEANDISPRTLQCYYESEQMYPFFTGIFQDTPSPLTSEQRALE